MSNVNAKAPKPVVSPKDKSRQVHEDPTSTRDMGALGLIERGGAGAGKHKNKQDFERGHARSPKHKGRGYEEGMGENVKKASDESLAYYLLSWWDNIYDELVAESTLGGNLLSRNFRDPNFFEVRILLPDPFTPTRHMVGDDEPHIILTLRLKEAGVVSVSTYIMNEGRTVVKKESLLHVMGMRAGLFASKVYKNALDLFESTEF